MAEVTEQRPLWQRLASRKFLVAVAGMVALAFGVEQEALVAAVAAAYVAVEGLIDAIGRVVAVWQTGDHGGGRGAPAQQEAPDAKDTPAVP